MKKIITLTTDGDSREDGSVYYSQSILVDSMGKPGLNFSEPIFGSPSVHGTDPATVHGDFALAISEIGALGYSVEELENVLVFTE